MASLSLAGHRRPVVAAVRSPVKFELLVSVGYGAVVVVDVEVAGCFVAQELEESVFEGEAAGLVFY